MSRYVVAVSKHRRSFCESRLGWRPEYVEQVVRPVLRAMADTSPQSRIERFFTDAQTAKVANITSARVAKAVAELTGMPCGMGQ